MIFKNEEKVYYADTDAYGVVWHGTYLRWLEAARSQFCDAVDCPLDVLAKEHNIIFPVVNINISYKRSAKLYANIVVETEVKELTKLAVVFHQRIKDQHDDTLYVDATVKAVAVNDKTGELYRHFPDVVYDKFKSLVQ